MTILLDDDEHAYPTFMNIVDAFKRLSEESQPGDAVFIQFSGHGGRVLDAPSSDTSSSYDEVICPCDYKMAGLIRDTLIFKTLLAPMRFGVTVTIIIDCCDTGMVLELPYAWRTNNEKRDIVAKVRFWCCQIVLLMVSHGRINLMQLLALIIDDDERRL